MMRGEPGKLALLYSHPGSYTRACLQALRDLYGWEILAIHYRRSAEAPFAEEPLQGMAECVDRADFADGPAIAGRVRSFGADVVQMVGWMDKGYLSAARILKRQGIPVVAGSDTQYTGSLRQWVAARIAGWYLHPAIDVLWVTGERQRQLAWKLGYRGKRCWSGMYCCDHARFAEAAEMTGERNPAFLYVGRYVQAKGLDVLLEAYGRYRKTVQNPWNLVCAGAGPLKDQLQGQPGVEDLGFVQPAELPALMARHSAFVLPSRKEPWGVVLQEAAAAGLPLICSDPVGAAVHLLQDHCNGFSFASESVAELAGCLEQVSTVPQERLAEMAHASRVMAQQFTPERWARTLVEGVAQVRASANPNDRKI
jgi:glycosyltransferase involved in cell wall biosynthesis